MKVWPEAYTLKREEGEEEVWERTYRLLTPLFGGGVEPKTPDPVTVVRAAEVRGQLRFFWRAIRGWRAEGSLDRLRELEAEVFGSTERPSPLVVFLETEEEGRSEDVFVDQPGKSFPKPRPEIAHPYLAFPLQRRQDPKNYPVRVGVVFRLTLRFPKDLREEVEAALWAWETFGGLGGRTRRGFGAIARKDAPPPKGEEIREKLKRYSRFAGWPEGVPHLTPGSLVRVVPLSWSEVARQYQSFRQDRAGQKGRGRNRWPEPDACAASKGGGPPPKVFPKSSLEASSASPSFSTSKTGSPQNPPSRALRRSAWPAPSSSVPWGRRRRWWPSSRRPGCQKGG